MRSTTSRYTEILHRVYASADSTHKNLSIYHNKFSITLIIYVCLFSIALIQIHILIVSYYIF